MKHKLGLNIDFHKQLMESNRIQQEKIHHDRNPVIKAFETLLEYIKAFEKNLDLEHEVGMNLVSYGQNMNFHIHNIGYSQPNIITFYGVTENNDKIQLVQHISQLSFLLMAVKKLEEEPKRVMGFIKDGEN